MPDGFKAPRPQVARSIVNAVRRELFFDPSFLSDGPHVVQIARPGTIGSARQQMKGGIDLLSRSNAQTGRAGRDRLAHLLRNLADEPFAAYQWQRGASQSQHLQQCTSRRVHSAAPT